MFPSPHLSYDAGMSKHRDSWTAVRIVGTDEEAALIEGFLQNEGVTVEVESLLFHQEPVTFGRLGEVRIWVPDTEIRQAEALLDRLESEGSVAAEDAFENSAE